MYAFPFVPALALFAMDEEDSLHIDTKSMIAFELLSTSLLALSTQNAAN